MKQFFSRALLFMSALFSIGVGVGGFAGSVSASQVSSRNSSFTIAGGQQNTILADNTQQVSVNVVVRDANGNALPGLTAYLQFQPAAGVTVLPAQTVTNADGFASFQIKSSQAGWSNFTPVVDGVVIDHPLVINYTGVVSSNLSTVTVSPASAPADGTTPVTVTVTARDTNGMTLSGKTVVLMTTVAGVYKTQSQVSNANGQVIFSVTSTLDGNGTMAVNIGASSVSVVPSYSFYSTISPNLSSMTISPISIEANGVAQAVVTVYVRDTHGMLLPGKQVHLSSQGVLGLNWSPTNVTTDANGMAQFVVVGTQPGVVSLTSWVDTTALQTGNLTFVSTGPAVVLGYSTLTASKPTAIANNADSILFVVTAKDNWGNPIANKGVTFSYTRFGSQTQVLRTTDGNGLASFSMTDNTPSNITVSAIVGGATMTPVSVQFVNAVNNTTVNASQSSVSYAPSSLVANDGQPVVIHVTVRNTNGVPLSGKLIQLQTNNGYTMTPGSPANPVTDSNGYVSISLRPTMSSGVFTLQLSSDGVLLTPTINVTMTAAGSCTFPVGTLYKLPDDGNPNTQADSAVYLFGTDCKRHAFPNARVYFSWYPDFNNVQVIAPMSLADMALGKNVTYRPGFRLVKFPSVNKVYVVAKGGALRWVTNGVLASSLFGNDWSQKVEDIPEAFYANYTFGADIMNTWDYNVGSEYNNANIND